MKRSLQANLRAYDADVWAIAITAPGADKLPCSDETCGHKGPHPQRAKDGCRVDREAAWRWNGTASERLAEVHRRAVQTVRRKLGKRSPVLAGVWQMQQRGVLHVHLVLGFSFADRPAAYLYVAELKRLCPEWGFGYVDARDRDGKAGKSGVMAPERSAGYLSSYLGESSQLAQAVALKDRPRRLVWVAPRLTRETGVTITRLRRSRHLWAHLMSFCEPPSWFADSVELQKVSLLLRGPVVAHGP